MYNIPESVSPACADLIKNILQVDIAKRYTLEQISKHPWLNKDPDSFHAI